MPLQGFSGGSATSGFQAGQAMNVQGAFGGMLQDLVAEWKKQKGEERGMQQKKELIEYEQGFKQTPGEEMDIFRQKEQIKRGFQGPWEKTGLTDLGRSKVLGTLRAGYYVDPMFNRRRELRDRQSASEFVMQQGYTNFQEDTEIMDILRSLPVKGPEQKPTKKAWFLGSKEKQQMSAQDRFNELIKFMTEEEAYKQMKQEEQGGKFQYAF